MWLGGNEIPHSIQLSTKLQEFYCSIFQRLACSDHFALDSIVPESTDDLSILMILFPCIRSLYLADSIIMSFVNVRGNLNSSVERECYNFLL